MDEEAKTKHVQFSREHIHRGVHYKPGDEADLAAPEADYLVAMGSAGVKPNHPPTRKLDVTRDD